MYNVEKTCKRKLTGEDDNTPTPKKHGLPKVINFESQYPPVLPKKASDTNADTRNMQALKLEAERTNLGRRSFCY